MPAQFKRNPFLNTNSYQQRIIFYSHIDFNRPEIYIPWFLDLNRFTSIIPWILLMIGFLMLAAILWAFDFSNKLVGPYERVVREMDEIIAGKSKKEITFRQGDDMFIELFKRVNALIQKLP